MARRSKQDPAERISAYAKRIRDLREDSDLSQKKVAELLHVSQRTYADYELGRIRVPVDALLALAKYYNVDMNYMCCLSKKKNRFPNP